MDILEKTTSRQVEDWSRVVEIYINLEKHLKLDYSTPEGISRIVCGPLIGVSHTPHDGKARVCICLEPELVEGIVSGPRIGKPLTPQYKLD